MKRNDDLFRLIKSLEKPEKGYFKKYALTHNKSSEQQYLKLFDAIDAQNEYDEQAILKKFRNETFIKQLSVAKSYLWDLILKSQRSYNAQSSKFMRLNALMENGEILFEKGLFEQALSSWEKAKKLAEAFDEKAFILDIEAWKRRYFVDLRADLWDENVLPSFEETELKIAQYANTFAIQKIYFQITKFIKTHADFRNPEHKQQWEQILAIPILALENEPEDFYGRLYFNYIHANFYNLSHNEEKNMLFISKVIALWEANPLLIEVEPIRYISAVNNYLSALSKFGRFEAFSEYVNNFTPPSFNSIGQHAIYYEHWWRWKEITFKVNNDINGLSNFIQNTYTELIKFSPYINAVRWMLIRFAIAAHYFRIKDYSASLKIVDELIETKDIELRKDIQAHTRMMYLIIHYELNHTLLLESISRSVKRYLKLNETYYDTESLFIKHYNKLIYAQNKTAASAIIADLTKDIMAVFMTNKSEKFMFESMPLCDWLNIKLNN